MVATRKIGEQTCSCLPFASSAHSVVSEVMEIFVFLYFYEILRASHLLLYHRILAISCVAKM